MRILASPLSLLLFLVCGFAAAGRASNVVEGTTAASDGVSLAYDVRGQGDTAMVFVHCWACDRTFWREQLEAARLMPERVRGVVCADTLHDAELVP